MVTTPAVLQARGRDRRGVMGVVRIGGIPVDCALKAKPGVEAKKWAWHGRACRSRNGFCCVVWRTFFCIPVIFQGNCVVWVG